MRKTSQPRANDGYALVVIAALFAAFAVIATAVLDSNVLTREIDRNRLTREQLSRLSMAIIRYAAEQEITAGAYRYPCPAAYNVAATAAAFGVADSACETGTPSGIDILSGGVIRGMVPVTTLIKYGLNIDDAFDVWNNRIMYIVERQLTPNGTGVAGTLPTFTDAALGTTFAAPRFILLSYGRDRMGAIARTKTTEDVSCPAASVVVREENCDDDVVFWRRPLFIASTATTATYFDDIITGYTE